MPLSVSVSCPEPVEVALVTPDFGTGMHSDGVSGNVSDSEKVKRVTVALAEATPDSASTTAAPLLTTTRFRRTDCRLMAARRRW